jgi:hypothetical protein
MSVYVGIDVHRKRSQVAVIDQAGQVLANRNVPNGVQPILKVIGGLPPGTPAAFEACYGTSWLVELLEDYGFDPHLVHPSRCKAIASARLKNDSTPPVRPSSAHPASGTPPGLPLPWKRQPPQGQKLSQANDHEAAAAISPRPPRPGQLTPAPPGHEELTLEGS